MHYFSVFSVSVCKNFFIFHKQWESRYDFVELSKNDANLLTRESVFIFVSKKLGEIDSEIGN
jgi:hypothetical protein